MNNDFRRTRRHALIKSKKITPQPAHTTSQPEPIKGAPGNLRRRYQHANTWLKRHERVVLGVVIVTLLLVGGGLFWLLSSGNYGNFTFVKSTFKPKKIIYSPLTGEAVNEAESKRPVTGIMIENSPESRPQSGLQEAGVVFEAIAEGGITRFSALYQEVRPAVVGPVRSLRPYYLDWLAAFDASIAHVGGSPQALREVRGGSYRDIDQFFNDGTYWRASDRYAPHNVYTNFDRIDSLNQKKGFSSSNFTGFPRKNDTKTTEKNATEIDVSISAPLFNSHYTYQANTNTYLRSQGGGAHTDREKGQIAPKVVIVFEAPMNSTNDDGYHESIQTVGSGKAYIFQDGTLQAATWRKGSKKEQISFVDSAGKPIALNRGQTWLTCVQTGKAPTWK